MYCKPAMYVHVSQHSETFVLSVDDCLYFLLREFHFLCYQPLCPFLCYWPWCSCSVLSATMSLSVFRVSAIVSVFVFFVSAFFSVSVFCVISHHVHVLCYQPLCPCPYSVFCVSAIMSVSLSVFFVTSHHVRVHVPCSVFCVSAIMFVCVFCVIRHRVRVT